MFLALGEMVPLGLRHAGLLREVAFPQAVGADDVQRQFATRLPEPQAAFAERHQAVRLHVGEQFGRLAVADVQRPRHAVQGRHLAVHFALQHMFQGVLAAHPYCAPARLPPAGHDPDIRPEQQDGDDEQGNDEGQADHGGES